MWKEGRRGRRSGQITDIGLENVCVREYVCDSKGERQRGPQSHRERMAGMRQTLGALKKKAFWKKK